MAGGAKRQWRITQDRRDGRGPEIDPARHRRKPRTSITNGSNPELDLKISFLSLCLSSSARTGLSLRNKAEPDPHTITDTFIILDTDGNHLLSKHHWQENIPSSSKGLASTRERRMFEKDWWQSIKTILRRGRDDLQFTLNWSHLGIAGLISCLYEPRIGVFQSGPASYRG